MDLGIKGKVALVAASSKGIGKAIAAALADEGVNLSIFSRSEDEIERTASEIRTRFPVDILASAADVTSKEQINRVIEDTVKALGGIDILINNAGGPPFGFFEDFESPDWQNALELNLLSCIYIAKKTLPIMKKHNSRRIVNITSIAVKQPIDGLILSNTSRAGLIGFSKTLSNELAKYNILVNNICPGRIYTDRIKALAEKRAAQSGIEYEKAIEEMEKDIPLQRIGTPEELAALACFLASEKASYMTGTTIQVDGGLLRGLF
ncbi:MAG: SDR family oxidoreductase [Candidatus Dadabacteria bacterium]|nr:SDR family oxidoreductase [Candidatus Dadabacteria bacterium]